MGNITREKITAVMSTWATKEQLNIDNIHSVNKMVNLRDRERGRERERWMMRQNVWLGICGREMRGYQQIERKTNSDLLFPLHVSVVSHCLFGRKTPAISI